MQLRAERERLGYTRDQAAERADITSRYLAAIELSEKIPKADVLVKLIRGMGASANTVIYASQQEADDECERLARLFLQCTPREAQVIAAIIDTILDQHGRRTRRMRRRNHVFALKKHEGHCSILRSNALFHRERPVFTLCRLLSSISRSVYCSVRGNLFVILYPRFHIRFSFTSYLFHIFSCRAIGCALSEDYSILRSSMQNYIGKCAVYFSKFF